MSIATRAITGIVLCLGLGLLTCESAWPQVSVWTHRNDNARTGANLAETQLNTSNVNPSQFGKLFSYAVDADIYTQPLVIPAVGIQGKGLHDVVYVATNNNSVYAFDADNNQGANSQPLWHVNFNGPGVTPIPASDVNSQDNIRTPGPIGIMGTPVIDQTTGTMYLVARTKETTSGTTRYVQRLHALGLTSGAEKFGGPVAIQASVAGTGYDNVGGIVTFNPLMENQRTGLALANGKVYIAWASYGDTDPYHGWVMAYSASTLQQVGVLCVTPIGGRGGIWQSGQPLSVDALGNLYVATGNGDFDGVQNFGETILKLSPNLSVIDWFTPDNWAALNTYDLDLSSAGVLLVPGSTDLIGAGKQGAFYVLNQSNLGHTRVGNGQIVQTFQVTGGDEIHGSPTYWNGPSGPRAYVWGAGDYLKAFAFNGSALNTTPISKSTYTAPTGLPGGFLTLSAKGSQAGSGILWASIPYADDAEAQIVSGVLHAFDATDLTHELWNTRMVPARDDLGNFAKFVPPTVANGRVYVASFSNRLLVYGLLASIPPATGGAIVGNGAASSTPVNLTATGTSDWAHWPGYDGKSSGNAQISDSAFLGAAPSSYSNDPRAFSWNDGILTVCTTSTEGVSVAGTSNGFLITVPADTAMRTLKLYVGGANSRGMLTAHLSDGSAPDFVDTGFSSIGQYDVVYTLNYNAASDGEQLTILWTLFSGGGNVTLQAAALSGVADSPPSSGCIWVDDAVPAGATIGGDGEGWNWVSSNPAPYSGTLAHQSALLSGEHQHYFYNATTTLPVAVGDTLFTYVYLDPANPPSEVMLQWNDGSWEHRAYWGSNSIAWGTDGTVSRHYMGALPATGQWVLLAVPAAQVGLEGHTLNGMAYTLYNGRATWDYAGKTAAAAPLTYQVSGTVTLSGAALSGVGFTATGGVSCSSTDASGNYACTVPQGWSGTVTPSLSGYTFTPTSLSYSNVTGNQTAQNYTAATGTATVWVEDAVPAGASAVGDTDGWNWVSSNPAPYSGALAHQSALLSGEHQHYFQNATASLSVAVGDTLFTYVYLDPANPPSEVMLQWNDGSWEHRAYWGANSIAWGTDGTVSRHAMGALPPTGQWVLLAVPAAQVGLEGHTLNGMAYTLYNGRATWDYAGKTAAAVLPTYQVSGTVTLGGAALSGVSMVATGGVSCSTSNASGSYACTVPQGWSGTVTPALSGYTFTPTSLSYSNVTGNQTAQNYTAATGTATVWVEDAVPAGASAVGDTDGWNWVSSNPAPYSGALAHQSALLSGEHQHYFQNATASLSVAVGDTLFTYVYLDPANPPSEVMLQWNDGSWEHRAYWGANSIAWGTDGTVSRHAMGALPPTGQWVLLAVPAAQVGLEGHTLNGMAYTLYNGRATWDYAGKTAAAAPLTYQVSGTVTLSGAALSGVGFTATGGVSCSSTDASGNYACTVPQGWSGTVTPSLSGYTFTPTSLSYSNVTGNQTAQNYTAATGTATVWVEDAVPAGASAVGDTDGWNWVSSNPAPYSGALAHQSALLSGEHQHYFQNATASLSVAVGDTLFTYVYLDPANPPSEVMLQWNDGSWEHRAYWGANSIAWGTDGTVSRHYMGALPATGQWVLLAVPAAQVGLEGHTLNGMAYTLYNGRATWDYAGKF